MIIIIKVIVGFYHHYGYYHYGYDDDCDDQNDGQQVPAAPSSLFFETMIPTTIKNFSAWKQ